MLSSFKQQKFKGLLSLQLKFQFQLTELLRNWLFNNKFERELCKFLRLLRRLSSQRNNKLLLMKLRELQKESSSIRKSKKLKGLCHTFKKLSKRFQRSLKRQFRYSLKFNKLSPLNRLFKKSLKRQLLFPKYMKQSELNKSWSKSLNLLKLKEWFHSQCELINTFRTLLKK